MGFIVDSDTKIFKLGRGVDGNPFAKHCILMEIAMMGPVWVAT
jgi:hypothetical protein